MEKIVLGVMLMLIICVVVKNEETVDAVPVVHGKWRKKTDGLCVLL